MDYQPLTAHLPRSQRGPQVLKALVTFRRLEVGEHRRVGDYYLSYGTDLVPVEPEWISRWFTWRNRVTAEHCPHYRVTKVGRPVSAERKIELGRKEMLR